MMSGQNCLCGCPGLGGQALCAIEAGAERDDLCECICHISQKTEESPHIVKLSNGAILEFPLCPNCKRTAPAADKETWAGIAVERMKRIRELEAKVEALELIAKFPQSETEARLRQALHDIGEDPRFEDPATRPSAAEYRHMARKALILSDVARPGERKDG